MDPHYSRMLRLACGTFLLLHLVGFFSAVIVAAVTAFRAGDGQPSVLFAFALGIGALDAMVLSAIVAYAGFCLADMHADACRVELTGPPKTPQKRSGSEPEMRWLQDEGKR